MHRYHAQALVVFYTEPTNHPDHYLENLMHPIMPGLNLRFFYGLHMPPTDLWPYLMKAD